MAAERRVGALWRHISCPATTGGAVAADNVSALLDQVMRLDDGRTVSYSDYGGGGTPVIWCHGGPGNKIQTPAALKSAATLGLRLIGIDRPGYGGSSLEPHRCIADWAPVAIAVADALGIAGFLAVGVSTGGPYPLALASLYPERVMGVVLGCAISDFTNTKLFDGMPGMLLGLLDRDAAIAEAIKMFGEDGRGPPDEPGLSHSAGGTALKDRPGGDDVLLPPADAAVVAEQAADPAAGEAKRLLSFANGVEGYVDDRRADAVGWGSFDLGKVVCPVIIVHGEDDPIVPLENAHYTKSLLPQAELRTFAGLGHLSIGGRTMGAAGDLAAQAKSDSLR